MNGFHTFEVAFLGAMLVGVLATPLVTYIARTMRIVDQPGPRKVHASAIPRIGGAAIVLAMLATVLLALALDNRVGEAFRQSQTQIIAILAGGLFMFAVGLIDDIRGLRARVKLFVQLVAAATVCAAGVRIESVVLDPWLTLNLGWLSWPITMLWIVGITNALNLIDGLDGLAAGIGTVTCGVMAVFALYVDQPVTAVLMLSLLGGLLGFLFLNFNPARIFMGDCGSLFLGFVISAASVRCASRAGTVVGLALPLLALGVPVLDTLLSIVRRILERRSIFAPDKGHIHHRLLQKGLNHRQVAIIVYVATLIAAGLGMFMIFIRGVAAAGIFALALFLLVLVFRAAGAMRLRDAIASLRHNKAIAREVKQQLEQFDGAELAFREAKCFEEWWQAVCRAAQALEFARVSLDVANRDGTSRTLLWRSDAPVRPQQERVTVIMPIRQRRAGGLFQAEVEVGLNGSVESAGRRVTFFGRLMDEHSVAGLSSPHAPSSTPARGAERPAATAG
jgi:UDP-N-acetylmuramyl pentapeptide phosphotransferase/UDP-N-acetylglucosamine-1-phosphate transferase